MLTTGLSLRHLNAENETGGFDLNGELLRVGMSVQRLIGNGRGNALLVYAIRIDTQAMLRSVRQIRALLHCL